MEESLKNIDDKDFEKIWEVTKEINENIRHYNEHQTKYRTLASQWLIAAMAGIGFLFDAKTGLPFSNLLLIVIISLISALGILQLWRMDLVVFQRIIASFFSAGLSVENENPPLPQIKHRIRKYMPYKNAGQNLFYFYYFIIAMFLLLATFGFYYLPTSEKISNLLSKGVIKVLSIFLYAIIIIVLYRYMKFMSSPEKGEKKQDEEEENKKIKRIWWKSLKPYWW